METKQTQKSIATKEEIYDEAIKLFMSKPYDLVTIEEIEANADKTKGASFYHIKDKHELFEQVMDKYFVRAYNIYEILGEDILDKDISITKRIDTDKIVNSEDILKKDITLLDFINKYTSVQGERINSWYVYYGQNKDTIDKKIVAKMETAYLGLLFYAGFYLGDDYIDKMGNNFRVTKETWSFFIQKAIEKGEVKPNVNAKLYGEIFTSIWLGQAASKAFEDGVDFKKIRELFMEVYDKIKA